MLQKCLLEIISVCSYQTQSEGDNVLGIVRPSVRLSVCPSTLSRLNRLFVRALLGARLCRVQQRATASLCVCNQWAYADNCTDAVDRLLIFSVATNGLTDRSIDHPSDQHTILFCQHYYGSLRIVQVYSVIMVHYRNNQTRGLHIMEK